MKFVHTVLLLLIMSGTAMADRVPSSEPLRLHQEAVAWMEEAQRVAARTPAEAQRLREQALRHLLAALRQDPRFGAAGVSLGQLLLEMNRHQEAIDHLERLTSVSPRNVPLRHLLGLHLFRMHRYTEGTRELERVAQSPPVPFDVHYVLAGHYYRIHQNEATIRHAQAYLRQRPDDSQVHGLLGNTYLRAGRTEQALASFGRVLELDPANVPVRVNLGNVFYQMKDYDAAVLVYREVLERQPNLALVHFNLGNSLFALEKWGDALESFQAFVDLEPNQASGHYFSGAALLRLNQTTAGIAALAQATMLDMQDARAPYLIGRTALESGDLSTATIFAQTALERKPDEERILLLAGIIARHRGDYASAIRLLSQAVAINARAAEARAQLGYARILAGSLDGGIEDLESARALMPQEPHVIAWLPVARTRRAVQRIYSGEIELAESDLRRSLEVQPALIEATWNLALLRDTQGDTPGGIQIVQRAIHATPTNANLHLLAAYLLVRQGDMIPAQAALERATGTDSVGLRWLVQGAIHGHFGEYDAAISSFEQARSNGADPGPALALARLDRAAALIRRGRIERALSELRTLGPNLGPNEARVQAGLLSAAMLAQDTGFDELPRLIAVLVAGPAPAGWALDRLYRDADLILGYAQYRQGNERTALEHLERHYANNNNDARVAPLLSTLLIDLAERDHHARRYASAELRLNRAIALTPDNPRAVHNLACVQYNRGNREEAATRFQALREGSHIAEATLNLGLYIDEVKNRGTEAMDLYREYLSLGGIAREVARRRIERKERIFGP